MTGGFWEMGFVVIGGLRWVMNERDERAMEDVARHCLAGRPRELYVLLVGWRSLLLFFFLFGCFCLGYHGARIIKD
jgi:hypothetical protein